MKTEPGKMKLVYNPATAQYRDSMFNLTVSPILGISYSSDGSVAWKNGAKAYGSYGKWGFFAALQDNHQDPLLGAPEYLTSERGGHIKERHRLLRNDRRCQLHVEMGRHLFSEGCPGVGQRLCRDEYPFRQGAVVHADKTPSQTCRNGLR